MADYITPNVHERCSLTDILPVLDGQCRISHTVHWYPYAPLSDTRPSGDEQCLIADTTPSGDGQCRITDTTLSGDEQCRITDTTPSVDEQCRITDTIPSGDGQCRTTDTTPSGDEQCRTTDTTPCTDEQCRIINIMEHDNSDAKAQEHIYLVSTDWFNKWRHHVGYNTTLDKTVHPGRLRIQGRNNVVYIGSCDLDAMDSKPGTCNMWAHEDIWCKWVQWYGLDDRHELDRYQPSSSLHWWVLFDICSMGPCGKRLENPRKAFSASEECGYIELQLRRIFGVAAGTETLLWVYEKTNCKSQKQRPVLDRSKHLVKVVDIAVAQYPGEIVSYERWYLFFYSGPRNTYTHARTDARTHARTHTRTHARTY